MQHTVEQRPDGWFVIVADGHEAFTAYFSDRATAQAIAEMLSPAPQARRQGPPARRRERHTRDVAS